MGKKVILLVFSWYLFFCAFYLGNFWEYGLPETENSLLLFLIVPYLGMGALVWSAFVYGLGVIALCLGLGASAMFLKSNRYKYLSANIIVGAAAGGLFRAISS